MRIVQGIGKDILQTYITYLYIFSFFTQLTRQSCSLTWTLNMGSLRKHARKWHQSRRRPSPGPVRLRRLLRCTAARRMKALSKLHLARLRQGCRSSSWGRASVAWRRRTCRQKHLGSLVLAGYQWLKLGFCVCLARGQVWRHLGQKAWPERNRRTWALFWRPISSKDTRNQVSTSPQCAKCCKLMKLRELLRLKTSCHCLGNCRKASRSAKDSLAAGQTRKLWWREPCMRPCWRWNGRRWC